MRGRPTTSPCTLRGPSRAELTFNPSAGTGYVAKADVQVAFGWKDGTFQANARRLGFHSARYTAWSWECVVDGDVVTLQADQQSSWALGSEIVVTTAGRRAVSGFQLTGLGAQLSSTSDAYPAICPAGEPANVQAVSTDVLYVDLRGRSEVLWTS